MRDGVAGQPARNRRFHLFAGLLAAALFLAVIPAENVDATQDTNSTTGVHILTVPAVEVGVATAINSLNWIAVDSPGLSAGDAWIWPGSSLPFDLNEDAPPGASDIRPADTNDFGVVVGGFHTPAGFPGAFRWSPTEGFTDLGSPNGHSVSGTLEATAVDEAGRFAGTYSAAANTCYPSASSQGCGFYGEPGAIAPNLTVITGDASTAVFGIGNGRAVGSNFTWTDGGGLVPLSSGTRALAGGRHVAESGEIAGYVGDGSGTTIAAYWSAFDSDPVELGTLGGSISYAWSVNDNGEVVGWSEVAGGAKHAFYWSSSTGMIDLGTLPGGTNSEARDINDAGLIVGTSDNVPVIWDRSGTFDVDYPPEIEPIPPQSVNVGNTLTVEPVISDPDGPSDTYTVSWSLPSGATPSGDGFEWTPTADDAGDHQATITVTPDGDSSLAVSKTIEISVVAGVELEPIGDKTATVDVELSFTVTAQGPNPIQYAIFGETVPDDPPPDPDMTIDPISGLFTWTPSADQAGQSLVVTFVATDGPSFDSETITITVSDVGGGPDVTIDVVESIIVDDSPLVAPAVAILVQEGITVIDNVNTELAVDLFIVEDVTVSDDPSVHPPIEILVTEDIIVEDLVDVHPPVVVNIGEEIFITDTATSELSVMISVTETLGVVDTVTIDVIDNTGSITGTKWADTDNNGARNPGEPGLAGVTVYADLNDNGVLDTGEPSTLTLDDDPLTFDLETGRYTLDALNPGDYVIREVIPTGYIQTYPTGDGSHGVSVTAGTDIVGIDFGNHLPLDIAPIDTVVAAEGTEIRVEPTILPEGTMVDMTWDDVPAGAITNGVFIWTPSETQGPGEYMVTVTATEHDNPANSDTESFLVIVEEVDNPPVIAPIEDVVVDEGQEVTIVPQVFDPEGDSYTIGWDGVPPGSITNGVFPYTPPEEHGPGQYLVTVTATQDSKPANSDTETFLITVNEVDGPPVEVPTVPGDVGAGSAASGDTVVVSGTGYLPGTDVTVLLFSDPVYLDAAAVGSDGTFQTTVTIPIDTSSGLHRIVVVGLESPYDGLVTTNWILVVPAESECTIVGTDGHDWLRGTPGDDVICGLGGNDIISGRRGNDIILGGEGNDLLLGGAGDDLISGGEGNDALYGNRHDDILEGGSGIDILTGGGGADSYVAPEPEDLLVGVWRNDEVLE